MINYKTELEYFNNTYDDMNNCDECQKVKELLYTLIELNSIEDIATHYNSIKANSDIQFLRFEEELKTNDYSLEDIKTRIVTCAIDRLLRKKYNQ